MEALEKETILMLPFSSWRVESNMGKTDSCLQKASLDFQNEAYVTTFLRYFSQPNRVFNNKPSSEIFTVSAKKPARIHTKVSPNAAQIFVAWISDFLINPESFAEAISRYFKEKTDELRFFAEVTTPSIFHHYASLDFIKFGYDFLSILMTKIPSSHFAWFFSSYLLSTHSFQTTLFSLFEKNSTSDNYFHPFIHALSLASTHFTQYQLDIIKLFHDYDLKSFSATIIYQIIFPLFYEYFNANRSDPETHPFVSILHYIAKNPASPHFTKIYEALQPERSAYLMWHKQLHPDGRTPCVITGHSIWILQDLVFSCQDLVNVKLLSNLKIPDQLKDSIDSYFYDLSFLKKLNTTFEKSDNVIFERRDKLKFDADSAVKRAWQNLSTRAAEKGTNPWTLFTSANYDPQLQLLMSQAVFSTPELKEYGIQSSYNNLVIIRNEFENFLEKQFVVNSINDQLINAVFYRKLCQRNFANLVMTDIHPRVVFSRPEGFVNYYQPESTSLYIGRYMSKSVKTEEPKFNLRDFRRPMRPVAHRGSVDYSGKTTKLQVPGKKKDGIPQTVQVVAMLRKIDDFERDEIASLASKFSQTVDVRCLEHNLPELSETVKRQVKVIGKRISSLSTIKHGTAIVYATRIVRDIKSIAKQYMSDEDVPLLFEYGLRESNCKEILHSFYWICRMMISVNNLESMMDLDDFNEMTSLKDLVQNFLEVNNSGLLQEVIEKSQRSIEL